LPGLEGEGLIGGGDVGIRGLGEIGEEDVMPGGYARGGLDILHIEDIVLQVLEEDSGLDLEGGLRCFEPVFQLEQVGGGAGDEVEGVDQAEAEGSEGENGDDAHEGEGTDAAGAHGGDFAVAGEAGEAEKDSREDGGGEVTVRVWGGCRRRCAGHR